MCPAWSNRIARELVVDARREDVERVLAGAYGKAEADAILSGKVQPANVKEPLERLVKLLDAMH